MDAALNDFLAETEAGLGAIDAALGQMRQEPHDAELRVAIARNLHAIKGACAFFEFAGLEHAVDEFERHVPIQGDPAPPDVTALDAALARVRSRIRALEHVANADEPQDGELEPLSDALAGLPTLVHHLGERLGKAVDLAIDGPDTRIERKTRAALLVAVTQLVRNAADHGIEPAAERRSTGKADRGLIRVTTGRDRDGALFVEVADDGRGFDAEAIFLQAGAPAAESAEPETEIVFALASEPGVTTADAPGEVSGRGVGLALARSRVEAVGGVIALASTAPGRGTAIRVTIPRRAAADSMAGREAAARARGAGR